MFEPLGIVPLWEVRSVMGASTLLPSQSAGHNGLRDIEERLELERLHKIRIKYLPFVLHGDGGGTMDQGSMCRECNGHRFVSPNEAQIETHQLAKLFSNLPGSDGTLLCQQPPNATLFDDELVCCEYLW
jgi:hypothetical protein